MQNPDVLPVPAGHPYGREVASGGGDSLSRIAGRIRPGSTVLDLGTGPGALGAYLRQRDCRVDGVDCDPSAVGRARSHYRSYRVAELEAVSLASLFPGCRYDYLVCADVLEHLRDPGRLLRQVPEVLEPGGRLLLSVPNVGYCGLIGELLRGEFRYRPTGLLDATHLRFFTRRSILDLLRESGLTAAALETVEVEPAGSEFTEWLHALPPRIQGVLRALPDALTYQFVIEALAGPAPEGSVTRFPNPPLKWSFAGQLFWLGADGESREEESVVRWAPMDESRQTVTFPIPPGKEIAALRLDPADRPGYLHLFAIRLLDAAGRLAWEAAPEELQLLNGEEILAARKENGSGAVVLLTGPDPSLFLPVDAELLKIHLRDGGRLEVDLSWPASTDFVVLAQRLSHLRADFEAGESRWQKRVDREAAGRQTAEARRRDAEEALAWAQEELELRQAEILLLHKDVATLRTDARGSAARLAATQAQTEELQNRVAAAEALAVAFQATLSWRITAPLRRLRAQLRSRRAAIRATWRWRLHRPLAVPHRHLERLAGNRFRSTGVDPQMIFRTGGTCPTGWCLVAFRWESSSAASPVLYFDQGGGYAEENKVVLPVGKGRVNALVRFPDTVVGLRFDPLEGPGDFRLDGLRIHELGKVPAALLLAGEELANGRVRMGDGPRLLGKVWTHYRRGGLKAVGQKLRDRQGTDKSYRSWIAFFDTLDAPAREKVRREIAQMAEPPLISVLMPVYDPPEKYLRLAIESVRGQLYPHWELCIADDASTDPGVRRVLGEYEALDPRVRVVRRPRNGHICAASNSALEMARGEFVALLDHDDQLSEDALYRVAAEIVRRPGLDLLYSDEDKIDAAGTRFDPYFKPDWNPDLLLAQNFISHLGVYRRTRVVEIGGFRRGYEGSQDWDLALRMVEGTAADHICHIPRVLYHWRSIPGSTALAAGEKEYAREAAARALRDRFERLGLAAEVVPHLGGYWRVRYPVPADRPLVSLLIPTRNGLSVLRNCLDSILGKTSYRPFEILLVDNQSDDPQTLDYLEQIGRDDRVRVLSYDAPFNYSAINNFAVRQARGEILALVNNDIEVISPDWLEEMVSHAVRPEIGAVGAMLYYPHGTIQHAGVILGHLGVANHAYQGRPRGHAGQMGRACLVQNLSAVTAACLVVRRRLYQEIGGLDEVNLPVAFNDIDFCLKLREAGWNNLWTPFAELIHHESVSRGGEDTPAKKERFQREIAYMRRRWGHLLENDPAYNPNLSLQEESFSLAFPPRPAGAP